MADKPVQVREPGARRSRHVGAGFLSVLEIIVLGLLAAYVVLLLIPSAFTIESDCVGELGRKRITGDSYFAAAAVVGTFGWLAVGVVAIYAQIADRPRLALLVPLAWFAVFVSASLIMAVAIAPQLCPT
jgi:hypothetical protein